MKRIVVLFLLMVLFTSIERGENMSVMASEENVDFSTPQGTYLTYLYAVKNNNLELAKQCWVFFGENADSVLDVLVGIWVRQHQFNEMVSLKLHEEGKQFIRSDSTDAALDRTINRVQRAHVTVSGNTAELLIPWQEGDGLTVDVFHYTSDEPVLFQKIQNMWRIDMNAMAGLEKGSSHNIFSPGSMGSLMRETKFILDALIDALNTGQITTPEELKNAWEQKAMEIMTP